MADSESIKSLLNRFYNRVQRVLLRARAKDLRVNDDLMFFVRGA